MRKQGGKATLLRQRRARASLPETPGASLEVVHGDVSKRVLELAHTRGVERHEYSTAPKRAKEAGLGAPPEICDADPTVEPNHAQNLRMQPRVSTRVSRSV